MKSNINFLNGDRSHWTHVENENEATHFTHDLFSSGDYLGCAVQVTNRLVLLEDTELCERLGIEELHESYSTDSILFPIAALKDPEIIELFEGLEDYPVVDDFTLSEVESEIEEQCFKDFGSREFKRYLEEKDLISEEQSEIISNDHLANIYFEASRETNYNVFEVESGTSGYFDFESFGGLYGKAIDILKPIIEREISK